VGDVLTYFDELTRAMTWLGEQPDTVFIGQQVRYPGNSLFKTLEGVPMEKRIEFPVAENMQLGASIGMAMQGKTVISIFPRMDFLLCAADMLVNHLDKNLYPLTGKVIIRTCIGATKPMHPGVQHCGDYTEGLRSLFDNVVVEKLRLNSPINAIYQSSYYSWVPVAKVIIEEADLYGMESRTRL